MSAYSPEWFDTFLSPEDPPAVSRELGFFETLLPSTDFPRVLDVACGIGRHARALADAGYEVLGVDISEGAIAQARSDPRSGARFLVGDMRELDRLPGTFDVVACLWQSWGYAAPAENRGILADMAARARREGRVLLDIYNRDALSSLPPFEESERRGRVTRTTRTLEGDRFRVRIEYDGSDAVDEFDWQVFTAGEIARLGRDVGLEPLLTCAWFDPRIEAGPDHVRMQVLFERASAGAASEGTP